MPLKVLSVGWGVQSWAMAAMMALGDLPRADLFIHSDTTYERSLTYEFVKEWSPWLGERGIKVHSVRPTEPEVVENNRAKAVVIPAFTISLEGTHGQVRRQCTNKWKIQPIRRLVRKEMESRGIKASPGSVEMWTGITIDEFHRMRDSDVKYIINTYPLIDRRISRADCVAYLESHDLPVPVKSSCTFCPYQNTASWKRLKQQNGYDWSQAVKVDESIRFKRKGFELSVHPARLPLIEAVNIPEDFGAHQSTFEECESGFCWT